MRHALILAFTALALPSFAQHGTCCTDAATSGGQLTLSPESMGQGSVYAGLRIDYATYEHITDTELAEAAMDGEMLHAMDHTIMYSLDAAVGILDFVSAGLVIPYHRIEGYRDSHMMHGGMGGMGTPTPMVSKDYYPDGFGDASVWGHIRFLEGPFRIGARLGLEIPTGERNERGAMGKKLTERHQPGSGSWDFFGGLAAGYAGDRWALQAALSAKLNTRSARGYEIGDSFRFAVAGGFGFMDAESPIVVTATLDAWIEWHGRDRDRGHGLEDSSGWVTAVAPGIRLEVKPVILQLAVPLQLSNSVEMDPDQQWRAVLTVGVKF